MVSQADYDRMSTQDKESAKFLLDTFGNVAVRVRNMGGDGIPTARDASGGTLPTVVVAVPQRWVITVPGNLPTVGQVREGDYILRSGTARSVVHNSTILSGSGSPEGVVSARKAPDMYADTDPGMGIMYINFTAGANTGRQAIQTMPA